jgi:hypothetical protein
MRFYWVRDRVQQQQFNIYWAPGKRNLVDYYTKHHSATHHQQIRELYLHTTPSTNAINSAIAQALHVLQGCAKPTLGSTSVPRVQGNQNAQFQRGNTPAEHRASTKSSAVTGTHSGRCNNSKLIG